MHIAKQKGGPHGGPHTCGGRGRGEVPSASASCEPNSTGKPFLFPALFFSHTPQPWPVDEERQISLTTAGRAANQQGRLLDPKITFPKAFFFSLLDQYQHSFLLGSKQPRASFGMVGIIALLNLALSTPSRSHSHGQLSFSFLRSPFISSREFLPYLFPPLMIYCDISSLDGCLGSLHS